MPVENGFVEPVWAIDMRQKAYRKVTGPTGMS